jgi:hypothetical protein
MRLSCSDSPVTASQMDGVFGSDSSTYGFVFFFPKMLFQLFL